MKDHISKNKEASGFRLTATQSAGRFPRAKSRSFFNFRDNSLRNRTRIYEEEKRKIAEMAVSHDDYERMIFDLARKLKL